MPMANSDLSSSILPRSSLIPNPVETLDESSSSSSSPIASIGADAVQSLALSSPNRDGDDAPLSTEEVSIPPRNSDGTPSTPLDETLTVPSLVSLDHGESDVVQTTRESLVHPLNHSESNNPSRPQDPDEINESLWENCMSDSPADRHQWTPNVSPGYDTDDEFANEWSAQSLWRLKQEPSKFVMRTCVGAGLWNLGNSCFVNSVLQCFTHTVPLIESLYLYKSPDPCNCGNGRFCVISALRDHIEAALTTSRCSISPFPFLNNLNHFSPDFRRFQQQDAHEFLQAFLDKLEICCLDRSSESGNVSSQDVNIVQHVFGGRLVSKLRCCRCNSVSETFENSLGLSLEIEDVDNLQSALDLFTRVEKLDEKMNCDNCEEKVSKEKQLLLDKLPLVVTFHLKRFKNDGYFMEKIFNHVEFPLELDLQPYMSNSQNNEVATRYHLYALVEHYGSLAYGHYSSCVRSAPKIWHQFDDKQVTRIDEDSVLSQDSYIFFYAREGTPWFASTFEALFPLLEGSLQNPSPNSVLDLTNGECSSEISYENVCKSNKPCDSAGVPDLVHVKTEENCLSLSNESNEDAFQSAESSGEDSLMAEPLEPHDLDDDSNNLCSEKDADSCLAIERATTGDDLVSLLMVQGQDSSQKHEEGTCQSQLEQVETTENQEEEGPWKQPSIISDVADLKETGMGHRGLVKKLSPHARELHQATCEFDFPPKRARTY